MKKIVHIVPTFELGGVQTGILYSLNELREKYDYKVLVIGIIDYKWLETQSKINQDQIIWSGTNSIILGWLKAYYILKKENPTIIISSLWKSVILSVVYKLFNQKTKLIGFFHTTRHVHLLNNLCLKIIGKIQDRAFADSEVVKKYIEKKYSISKTDIIPFNFKFNKEEKELQKGINRNCIKLCYFGRFKKEKGIYRSLAFCQLLKINNIEFQFDMYGEGDIENLQLMIKKYQIEDKVTIHDVLPLHQVLKIMKNYDFLLQLSDHEGMALSVVEAMSVGLVAIVTPVGEIANYSKDGYNAIWLEPNFDENLEMLVQKVKEVILDENRYYQMSIAAQKSFVHYNTYSEAMIAALERLEN
jgi:glycosyltransferase involved in cell wall biosynthesis